MQTVNCDVVETESARLLRSLSMVSSLFTTSLALIPFLLPFETIPFPGLGRTSKIDRRYSHRSSINEWQNQAVFDTQSPRITRVNRTSSLVKALPLLGPNIDHQRRSTLSTHRLPSVSEKRGDPQRPERWEIGTDSLLHQLFNSPPPHHISNTTSESTKRQGQWWPKENTRGGPAPEGHQSLDGGGHRKADWCDVALSQRSPANSKSPSITNRGESGVVATASGEFVSRPANAVEPINFAEETPALEERRKKRKKIVETLRSFFDTRRL